MPDSPGAPPAVRPVPPTARPLPPTAPAPPAPKPPTDRRARLRWLDVAGATILVLAAAFAASADLTGPLRLLAALPLLLFAPGYLLLQAVVVPPARGASLVRQLLASVGLSPALVGLLALSTAIVAGAFKAGVIVAVVSAGCLAFATIAIQRRRAVLRTPSSTAQRAPTAAPVAVRPAGPLVAAAAPTPEAARAKSGTARP